MFWGDSPSLKPKNPAEKKKNKNKNKNNQGQRRSTRQRITTISLTPEKHRHHHNADEIQATSSLFHQSLPFFPRGMESHLYLFCSRHHHRTVPDFTSLHFTSPYITAVQLATSDCGSNSLKNLKRINYTVRFPTNLPVPPKQPPPTPHRFPKPPF